ncbi:MAG: transcriptional regulator [bacterium]
MIQMEDINRLKIVLVEKKKTSKWLSEQLRKDPSTVSKWCTNVQQSTLSTLSQNTDLRGINSKYFINDSSK